MIITFIYSHGQTHMHHIGTNSEIRTFVSTGSSLAAQREQQHTGDWAVELETPARQNLWNNIR